MQINAGQSRDKSLCALGWVLCLRLTTILLRSDLDSASRWRQVKSLPLGEVVLPSPDGRFLVCFEVGQKQIPSRVFTNLFLENVTDVLTLFLLIFSVTPFCQLMSVI